MGTQTTSTSAKVFKFSYILASLLIFLGLIFMCQPFSMRIFTFGFPTVLVGTLAYIVLDHLKH